MIFSLKRVPDGTGLVTQFASSRHPGFLGLLDYPINRDPRSSAASLRLVYDKDLWDGTAESIQSLAEDLLQRSTFEAVGLDESLAMVMKESCLWQSGYIWIYLKHLDKSRHPKFQTLCFPNFHQLELKSIHLRIRGILCISRATLYWAFRNGPKAAMTQSWGSHRVPFWQQHFAPDCWRKGNHHVLRFSFLALANRSLQAAF